MLETTNALLLRKTKLSDTSLIITWLTESHGRIKTVAKGARRPKSAFAGKLDLFFEAEIQYARSKHGELHTLREVASRNSHEALRLTLRNLETACYFVELIELVTEPDHPIAELYSLMLRAVRFLNVKAANRIAVLHFEGELVRALGIQDEDRCSASSSLGRAYGRLPLVRSAILDRLGGF